MTSHSTPARATTHSSSARHATAAPPIAYMRAFAIIGAVRGSCVAQSRPDAESLRLPEHRCAQRDIRRRQPAVPEQDRLVVALASRLQPGDDLAELGVECRFGQLAGLDVCTEAAELAGTALSPVVDDDLGR